MNAVNIKITNLHPNTGQIPGVPANPRFIKDESYEKLKQSIIDDPEMLDLRELLVYPYPDKASHFIIIGGNMRYRICKQLKYKDLPCKVIPKETPAEKLRAYLIKDNVGFGDWDTDLLANDWDTGELEAWGVDLPDFDTPEDVDVQDDEYELPDTDSIQTDIIPGDLFEIGVHRLICGDSTKAETFERLMQGELADMVITDPPYNVNYEGATEDKLKMQNDSMSNNEFYHFLFDFYSALATVVKKGGAIYVWHASSEIINFAKALVDAGWLLKQQLIWVKSQMVMGRQDYQWRHEPCLYGWLDGGSHKWYGDRKQTIILEFNKPQRNADHPTMKPVELFAYQVGNSSKPGHIVVDAFGGSGTSMVVCEQLKRKARIIEIDPIYCQVIIDRMLKLNPELTIKLNGVDVTERFINSGITAEI